MVGVQWVSPSLHIIVFEALTVATLAMSTKAAIDAACEQSEEKEAHDDGDDDDDELGVGGEAA